MRNYLTGMLFSAVVGVTALSAGCGEKKPAATCEGAGEHIMNLMMNSDEMKKASPEEKAMADNMMKGFKEEIIKDCKERKWDEKQLNCVVSAKKPDDIEKCEVEKK